MARSDLIKLDSDHNAIVSDFGFARAVENSASSNQTKTVLGPVKHMPPESLLNQQYSEKVLLIDFHSSLTAFRAIHGLLESCAGKC